MGNSLEIINEKRWLLAVTSDKCNGKNETYWINDLKKAFLNPKIGYPIYSKMNKSYLGMLNLVKPLIDLGIYRLNQGLTELSSKWEFDLLHENRNEIVNELIEHLIHRIWEIVGKAVVLELNVWRTSKKLEGKSSEERFDYFCEKLKESETALSILNEYPLLSRRVINSINDWQQSTLEFFSRLYQDRSELELMFELKSIGHLKKVNCGLGDQHNKGKTVMLVEFSSGVKVVYKPRSGSVDSHFQSLLTWLNHCLLNFDFKTIQLLDKQTYSWHEYVDYVPCSNESEVKRFYQRFGGYIAVLYFLEATDFHYENIIAHGENPVLVDLESLFQSRVTSEKQFDQMDLDFTVLRTGLLPNKLHGMEISGLGGDKGQSITSKTSHWVDIGKDTMHIEFKESSVLSGGKNKPLLNGQMVDVMDFEDDIVQGFEEVYKVFMNHKEELLSKDSPVLAFSHDIVRSVLRSTRIYFMFLNGINHPNLLRNATDQDHFLDKLEEAGKNYSSLRKLIPLEKDSLRNMDIPYFFTSPSSTDVWIQSGEKIKNFFARSALDTSKHRIQLLSNEDMKKQCWVIRSSIATLPITKTDVQWKEYRLPKHDNRIMDRDELLIESKKIGDYLENLAIENKERVTWLGLNFDNRGNWGLSPLNIDLYNGLSGVVLFLAYLAKLTQEEKYHFLARKALNQIRFKLNEIEGYDIGAFSGLSGVIYVLVHLSVEWNDYSLLTWADELVERIWNSQLIERDTKLDFIGGAAGCTMCVLNLYAINKNSKALKVAMRCGEHLLKQVTVMPEGVGWITISNKPLTGMAHGASGIALALAYLGNVTNDRRYKDMALLATKYEQSLFCSKAGNWLDLRVDNKQKSIVQWCAGAPGIGLSRLLLLNYLEYETIFQEIRSATVTTLNKGFNLNHSLCHGDLGNLDFLMQSASILEDAKLKYKSSKMMPKILDSILEHGWLCGTPLNIKTPGLMTGLSGIGLGLLRMFAPSKVPNVLALSQLKT